MYNFHVLIDILTITRASGWMETVISIIFDQRTNSYMLLELLYFRTPIFHIFTSANQIKDSNKNDLSSFKS